MADFTSGPWDVYKPGDTAVWGWCVGTPPWPMGSGAILFRSTGTDSKAVKEANARLAAAAPELLAEVERFREDLGHQIDDMRCDAGNWDGGSFESCEHCQAVRYRDRLAALIAKATGGPPP